MEESFYHQTAAAEDTHWYMVARRELVGSILRGLEFGGSHALEVGCGSGGNLPLLREFCPDVTGIDISETMLRIGAERAGVRLLRRDANLLPEPFAPGSFDLVADFNVLYHRWIDDDRQTLGSMATLLRPGGFLVLFEPAFQSLWRRHDEIDMGKKRYRLPELLGWLRECGLEIVAGSYFNCWAYLPALGLYRWEQLRPQHSAGTVTELDLPGPVVKATLVRWLRIESRWIRTFGRLPCGTTVFCLARKPRAVVCTRSRASDSAR